MQLDVEIEMITMGQLNSNLIGQPKKKTKGGPNGNNQRHF
jgi:hypothetical protein